MNRTPRSSFLLGAVCACLAGCGSSAPAGQPASTSPQPTAASPAAASGSAAGASAVPASTTPVTSGVSASSAGGAPARPVSGGAGSPATPAVAGTGASSAAGASAGDAGAGPAAIGGAPSAGPSGMSAFPMVSDFGMDGPFKAMTTENTGPNSNYTLYYPDQLAPNGAKNPIVVWMSGGGTTPSLYPLLPLLATHGFVVVASNTAPGIGDEVNLGKELVAGIDWAIAENGRDGSNLAGKLDTTKIAATGYSMGSLATFTIANDPRLTTTVHISGGNMAPERIDNLKAPAAFFCGIPGDDSCNILSNDCDIAAANCDTDFNGAKTPVFYGNFAGGHLGILTPPLQQQIQTEVVAWLRWQLMGDGAIKPRFVGDQCGVCKDSKWKVKQKNLN